jgi:2-polyprenyl-3-methyl-5-hydroxy-6-metoxy-1,4-benzoquinol methylase
MKQLLESSVEIIEQDLDTQFRITSQYDLVFLLGILYHLKNPFYVLEQLSKTSRHLILSTRIARHFTAATADASVIPAAYLLNADEANNDSTNYWIFTLAGLRRLAERTGWEVVAVRTTGDLIHSNPQDNDRDERAFALLRSRVA